jgi:hypothetical protein
MEQQLFSPGENFLCGTGYKKQDARGILSDAPEPYILHPVSCIFPEKSL